MTPNGTIPALSQRKWHNSGTEWHNSGTTPQKSRKSQRVGRVEQIARALAGPPVGARACADAGGGRGVSPMLQAAPGCHCARVAGPRRVASARFARAVAMPIALAARVYPERSASGAGLASSTGWASIIGPANAALCKAKASRLAASSALSLPTFTVRLLFVTDAASGASG